MHKSIISRVQDMINKWQRAKKTFCVLFNTFNLGVYFSHPATLKHMVIKLPTVVISLHD